jgi:hypothetical protein
MEQKAYTFKPFRKWFAEIERRKLPIGDYSIAGPIVNETRCFPGERTLSTATLRLGFLKRAYPIKGEAQKRIDKRRVNPI